MKKLALAALLIVGSLLGTAPAAASPTTPAFLEVCESNLDYTQCTQMAVTGSTVTGIGFSTTNLGSQEVCDTEIVEVGSRIRFWPACVPGQDGVVAVKFQTNFPTPETVCSKFATSPRVCVSSGLATQPETPTNAYGCATLVLLKQCITITGFANHVDSIKGQEYGIATGTMCGTERLLKGGSTYKSGSLCVPKGTGASASITWTLNQSYSTGTQFCSQYTTNAGTKSGKPCETIS